MTTEDFAAPKIPEQSNFGVGQPGAVLPLALLGVGGYLMWFGVHYFESTVAWPSDPIKALLTGRPLPPNTKGTAALLRTPVEPAGMLGARAALVQALVVRDSGKGYVFGGKADVPGDWDCSSAASYWLGHDLGVAPLPGGGKFGDPGYPPHAHGPGSTDYMLFGTGVNAADAQPGDLVVSTEHIGLYLGGGRMLSARDPQEGTGVGPVDPFPAGPPVYRRPDYP